MEIQPSAAESRPYPKPRQESLAVPHAIRVGIQRNLMTAAGIDPVAWIDTYGTPFDELLAGSPELRALAKRDPNAAEAVMRERLEGMIPLASVRRREDQETKH